MSETGNTRKELLFIVFAFGLSYALAGIYYALGGRLTGPYAGLVLFLYMYMPSLSAVIVQKWICKEPVVGPLGVLFKVNGWWLVAWLLPAVLVLGTLGISLLLPGIRFDPQLTGFLERMKSAIPPEQHAQLSKQLQGQVGLIFWGQLVIGMIAGVSVNAVAAFGEELGWRGFLQKYLGYMGFWKSSFLIGIIWGLWHAPIIIQGYNYPQHPVIGVFMMTLLTVLLAPIFGYMRLKGKSVIAAAIAHGTFNGTAGLAILVIRGGSDLTAGVTGLAGMIALALANVGIFLYDRNQAGNG